MRLSCGECNAENIPYFWASRRITMYSNYGADGVWEEDYDQHEDEPPDVYFCGNCDGEAWIDKDPEVPVNGRVDLRRMGYDLNLRAAPDE